MKTTIAILLATGASLFAGTDGKMTVAPAPPPPPPLYGPGFQIIGFGEGFWTQTVAHEDRYFGADHAFGGTLEAKYFINKYFGFGLGGSGYDVKNSLGPDFGGSHRFVGAAFALLTGRYPIGAFAPYATVGLGGVFNGGNHTLTEPGATIGKTLQFEAVEHDAKLMVQPALGLEYRFTKNFSLLTEGTFTKITRPQSNGFGMRIGASFNF